MSKARQLADLGNVYDDGALSHRNLIINGAMQVAQRGTSVTGVTNTQYSTVDRFKFVGNIGTRTNTQETDAPNGFSNSLKVEITTQENPPASGDYLTIEHLMEGQNLQMLKKGTAGALPVTVSFWVKSNVTGTYILEFDDNDNTRNINKSYTVSAANTWEYKTITYEGDTSGSFDNDASHSARLIWWLDAGSAFRGGILNEAWEPTNNPNRVEGNVSLGSAVGNYFQITGVQLEVGDTATPFEHRLYGDTLAKCKRYFERIGIPAGSNYQSFGVGHVHTSSIAVSVIPYEVEKRANPTASYDTASNFALLNASGGPVACTGVSTSRISTHAVSITANASGLVAGNATFLLANNAAKPFIDIEAEL